ncbi:glycosyltransferase [Sphingomonas baiyangensis]|uniref:Glycosyltransferase family 4 protein n=1 Tax=Sphingomonas baiyangensis TaxID=2572576 RepID=A0A4U1L4L9_9SPHN|nr:glycosyltransferase [Sphingomonas baiyangensis]TKD51135.1 glycosyltransferase family 4 protein [Sphingomonas baiyangensis]
MPRSPAAPRPPLSIAVLAHLRHPVAAPFMGGMEAHCDLLVRTLRAEGHAVTLFASGDSAGDLPLHAIAPRAYEAELPWARWRGTPELDAWLAAAYARAWEAIGAGGFDVVHNNSLFAGVHGWAARDGVPMLTSLHVPPFATLRDAIVAHAAPWTALTVPSRAQLPLWEGVRPDALHVAHNGIDLARWPMGDARGRRAIWAGRITPNKGTLVALRAATRAGIALYLAGPIECADYFAELAPHLHAPHRYLGHLAGADLAAAMADAAVALCTPMWEEPFGLVAAEALACGTPVAALDRGALGEVIGDCGALAADEAGLPAAIWRAMRVPRAQCRTRAEALFGAPAMVARYAALYEAVFAAAPPASSIASTRALLA